MGKTIDVKEIDSVSERINTIVKKLKSNYLSIESSMNKIKLYLDELQSYNGLYASNEVIDGILYRSKWIISVSSSGVDSIDEFKKKIDLLYGEKLDLDRISDDLQVSVKKIEDELGKGAVKRYLYGGKKTMEEAKANFDTYKLSDDEILQLARLCSQEQGSDSLPGIMAEASLIANLYELKKGKDDYGKYYDNIVDYAKYSGWWADSEYVMENGSESNPVNKKILNSVKKVFVDGKRTLPKYVDEHDSIVDLSMVKTNGVEVDKKNSKKYVAHKTVCYQNSERISDGEHWVYYDHPSGNGDPFGYSNVDNVKKYGNFCYEANDIINEIEFESATRVVRK